MPAPRASAVFEPIAPDLDLHALVESTPNFEFAPMIQCDKIDEQGIEQFEKLVLLHVILGGKPLVVQGFQHRLDQWTFSTQWLRDNVGKKFEQARDLTKGENLPLSIKHYLDNMSMLTNQWTPANYKSAKQRLYLKDIDCPETWHDKLQEKIPPLLFYLNENSEDVGGVGSHGKSSGSGFAPAGDLMSCLPPQMRAENMMCYIGHEGTYTPAHREMCASLGQNIMVEASGSVGEDGKPTKPGSSIWFMTESKDRHLVAEYWLSTLGHDIEVEGHFAQINAWAKAPFKAYVVEQKVGDFILIPPLAPHQVWNRGTRTMKAAWNRTTVETLTLALNEALPRARMVCRDEQYKNKAIVLFSLNRYSALLKDAEYQRSMARDNATLESPRHGKVKQLQKDFKRLFKLYNRILVSEMFSPEQPEKKVEYVPFDSNITCSYCRCNIFNRFLTCKSCIILLEGGDEDTYDVCLECYAMGRSCHCLSKLTWVEQFPWKDLVQKHDIWRSQLLEIDSQGASKGQIPLTLQEEHQRMETKTLAEVCQAELKRRPFQDPTKDPQQDSAKSGESDAGSNEDGTPRKKKKRRSEKWLREHRSCHICAWRHPIWKMAVCECGAAFCYGSLWRGFEMMPQSIMEDPYWRCPKCREICNCSKCRRNPHNQPYQPVGTILGHDTRKFADPRSIEALVDFSCSNKHWLKKAGDDEDPTETRRMHRRIAEAEKAKAQNPHLDDEGDEAEEPNDNELVDEAEESSPVVHAQGPVASGLLIDPLLVSSIHDGQSYSNFDQNRQVALEALNAMDATSTLERDPAAFVAYAGLAGTYDGAHDRPMIHTAANGITYGLSDPTAGWGAHSHDNPATTPTSKKKKKGGRKGIKSDLMATNGVTFADDANRRFTQSQTAKTMAEAKRTGRLISARAALTGDRLIVKLKLSRMRLARFVGREPSGARLTPDAADSVPMAEVRSDLPDPHAGGDGSATKIPLRRKRNRGAADDDDFGAAPTERQRRRVSKQPQDKDKDGDEDVRAGSDTNSDSDLETFLAQHTTGTGDSFSSTNQRPKRRSLPAYLARRSPVADAEFPRELQNGRSSHGAARSTTRGARAPAKSTRAPAKGSARVPSHASSDSPKRGPGRPRKSLPATTSEPAGAPLPPAPSAARQSLLRKSRGSKVKIVSEHGLRAQR